MYAYWDWRGFFYSFLLGLPWILHLQFARMLLYLGWVGVLSLYELIRGDAISELETNITLFALFATPLIMGVVQSERIFDQWLEAKKRLIGGVSLFLFVTVFIASPETRQDVPAAEWAYQAAVMPALKSVGLASSVDWRTLKYDFDMTKKRGGYKDRNGEWVINPQFVHLMGLVPTRFKEGRAIVALDKENAVKERNRGIFIDADENHFGPYFRRALKWYPEADLACLQIASDDPRGIDTYALVRPSSGEAILGPGRSELAIGGVLNGQLCRYFSKAKVMVAEFGVEVLSKGIFNSSIKAFDKNGTPFFEGKTLGIAERNGELLIAEKTLSTRPDCVKGLVRDVYQENRLLQMAAYNSSGKKLRTIQAYLFTSTGRPRPEAGKGLECMAPKPW